MSSLGLNVGKGSQSGYFLGTEGKQLPRSLLPFLLEHVHITSETIIHNSPVFGQVSYGLVAYEAITTASNSNHRD